CARALGWQLHYFDFW
nr:immunoglobulin heavy chain junction region [Macaca mulatta]MOY19492.1 immunoglobulin heavy chain junction region [Macaca mulatta]